MSRLLWILALAALAALVFYGMRRGWVHRAQRQSAVLPEFPAVPAWAWEDNGPQAALAGTGMYFGTTFSGNWQDRIAVSDVGHRANADVQLFDGSSGSAAGALIARSGASPLWIPAERLRAARVDVGLANKVIPGPGMVVLTWELGEQLLDTGIRLDGKHAKQKQGQWVEFVRETLLAAAANTAATQERTDSASDTRTDDRGEAQA